MIKKFVRRIRGRPELLQQASISVEEVQTVTLPEPTEVASPVVFSTSSSVISESSRESTTSYVDVTPPPSAFVKPAQIRWRTDSVVRIGSVRSLVIGDEQLSRSLDKGCCVAVAWLAGEDPLQILSIFSGEVDHFALGQRVSGATAVRWTAASRVFQVDFDTTLVIRHAPPELGFVFVTLVFIPDFDISMAIERYRCPDENTYTWWGRLSATNDYRFEGSRVKVSRGPWIGQFQLFPLYTACVVPEGPSPGMVCDVSFTEQRLHTATTPRPLVQHDVLRLVLDSHCRGLRPGDSPAVLLLEMDEQRENLGLGSTVDLALGVVRLRQEVRPAMTAAFPNLTSVSLAKAVRCYVMDVRGVRDALDGKLQLAFFWSSEAVAFEVEDVVIPLPPFRPQEWDSRVIEARGSVVPQAGAGDGFKSAVAVSDEREVLLFPATLPSLHVGMFIDGNPVGVSGAALDLLGVWDGTPDGFFNYQLPFRAVPANVCRAWDGYLRGLPSGVPMTSALRKLDRLSDVKLSAEEQVGSVNLFLSPVPAHGVFAAPQAYREAIRHFCNSEPQYSRRHMEGPLYGDRRPFHKMPAHLMMPPNLSSGLAELEVACLGRNPLLQASSRADLLARTRDNPTPGRPLVATPRGTLSSGSSVQSDALEPLTFERISESETPSGLSSEEVAQLVDPLRCLAVGDGLQAARAGEETTFVVHVRTTNDEAIRRPDPPPSVKFEGDVNYSYEVVDKADGSVRVTYVVSKSGSYRMHVLMAAESIAGSPFDVIVSAALADPAMFSIDAPGGVLDGCVEASGTPSAIEYGALVGLVFGESSIALDRDVTDPILAECLEVDQIPISTNHFSLEACDIYGNKVQVTGCPLKVTATGLVRLVDVVDNEQGTFDITYRVPINSLQLAMMQYPKKAETLRQLWSARRTQHKSLWLASEAAAHAEGEVLPDEPAWFRSLTCGKEGVGTLDCHYGEVRLGCTPITVVLSSLLELEPYLKAARRFWEATPPDLGPPPAVPEINEAIRTLEELLHSGQPFDREAVWSLVCHVKHDITDLAEHSEAQVTTQIAALSRTIEKMRTMERQERVSCVVRAKMVAERVAEQTSSSSESSTFKKWGRTRSPPKTSPSKTRRPRVTDQSSSSDTPALQELFDKLERGRFDNVDDYLDLNAKISAQLHQWNQEVAAQQHDIAAEMMLYRLEMRWLEHRTLWQVNRVSQARADVDKFRQELDALENSLEERVVAEYVPDPPTRAKKVQTEDAWTFAPASLFAPIVKGRLTGATYESERQRASPLLTAIRQQVERHFEAVTYRDVQDYQGLLKSAPCVRLLLERVWDHLIGVDVPQLMTATSFRGFVSSLHLDPVLFWDLRSCSFLVQLFSKFSVRRHGVTGIPPHFFLPFLRELAYLNMVGSLVRLALSSRLRVSTDYLACARDLCVGNVPGRNVAFRHFLQNCLLPWYDAESEVHSELPKSFRVLPDPDVYRATLPTWIREAAFPISASDALQNLMRLAYDTLEIDSCEEQFEALCAEQRRQPQKADPPPLLPSTLFTWIAETFPQLERLQERLTDIMNSTGPVVDAAGLAHLLKWLHVDEIVRDVPLIQVDDHDSLLRHVEAVLISAQGQQIHF